MHNALDLDEHDVGFSPQPLPLLYPFLYDILHAIDLNVQFVFLSEQVCAMSHSPSLVYCVFWVLTMVWWIHRRCRFGRISFSQGEDVRKFRRCEHADRNRDEYQNDGYPG